MLVDTHISTAFLKVLCKMKVVLISNFSDESVAESLLIGNLDETRANQKAEEWNAKNCSAYSNYHAVVKSDDYKLWRGMEDLI